MGLGCYCGFGANESCPEGQVPDWTGAPGCVPVPGCYYPGTNTPVPGELYSVEFKKCQPAWVAPDCSQTGGNFDPNRGCVDPLGLRPDVSACPPGYQADGYQCRLSAIPVCPTGMVLTNQGCTPVGAVTPGGPPVAPPGTLPPLPPGPPVQPTTPAASTGFWASLSQNQKYALYAAGGLGLIGVAAYLAKS